MSRSMAAALPQPRRQPVRHIVDATCPKDYTANGTLIAISHELSERLAAIGNYLAAASRLREIEPAAAFASHSSEILQKALAQADAADRGVRQLRRALSARGFEEPVSLRPAQKAPNPVYRVHFLNEFARNSSVIRACQRTITIRSARSPERAIEAAKKRFARIERIRDWRIHAQIVELEIIGTEIDAR